MTPSRSIPPPQQVLVTVSGTDTPGITAALSKVIADAGAELLDIEQVVVQDRLTLCLLVGLDGRIGESVLKDLLFTATNMGLELRFKVVDPKESGRDKNAVRYAITAIGDGMGAKGVLVLSEVLAKEGANIEHIQRLSEDDLASVEIVVSLSGGEEHAMRLRRLLLEAASSHPDIDIAVQRETLMRHAKRLIVMDMDSTLIQMEVIDELAALHGVADKVSAITRDAMGGALPYEESLKLRVAMLEGLEHAKVVELAQRLPLTEGAKDMLKVLRALGYKTAVISGGFDVAAGALKELLGLDYAYSHRLEVKDGKLTGKVHDPIVGPQRKADLLDAIAQREGIALEQTIAIGDGANDLLMLERAGLGIAFHAKPKLKEAADTALSAGGLDRILYLLGFRARDIRDLLATITTNVHV
ncbi:MAG: phosphoserine phosphatase SerB [Myxococcales bacterium]|nr:phosphoserine phosphatase SerB [Myxococcales bacterium]